MIETAPSIKKKIASPSVSDNTPPNGHHNSAAPVAIASNAESRAHQKPGSCRIQIVVARPKIPLSRNSQPSRTVTASAAAPGTMMAIAPKATSMRPSTRNSTQCRRIDLSNRSPGCAGSVSIEDIAGTPALRDARMPEVGQLFQSLETHRPCLVGRGAYQD